MQTNKTTNTLLAIIALVLIAGIALYFTHQNSTSSVAQNTTGIGTTNSGTSTGGESGGTTGTVTPPTPPVIPADMKQYSDPSFGFTVNYPDSLELSTTAAGAISFTGSTGLATTVAPTTNTAPDPSGKWGPYTVSYANGGYVVTQQNEQDGSTETKPITPIAYTTSGLPVFNGGIPDHGFGKYDYIVALSQTKFVTVTGPDTLTSASYDVSTDQTLTIVKSVALE